MTPDDTITDDDHAFVVALADAHGDRRAAELLRLDRASLLRLLLRRRCVRRGTLALVRARLAELRHEGEEPRAA